MPLVSGVCTPGEARVRLSNRKASNLFVDAHAPEEALGGLWLYFSCSNECHEIVQNLETREACFWHAILHRQEPDAGNASYWFHRVGSHAIFPDLCRAAGDVLTSHPNTEFRPGNRWNPLSFIAFCEKARKQPGSSSERAALEIQRAEWQLLFDYCARRHP